MADGFRGIAALLLPRQTAAAAVATWTARWTTAHRPMPGTRSTLARTARTNNTSAKINPAHTAMRRARNTRRISSPRNRCNFNHSQQRHRSSRAAPRKREHKGTLFAGVSPCIVSRQPWGRATRVASREPATAHAVHAKITRRRTRTATRRRWRPQSERRPESTPLPNARSPLFGIGRMACRRRGMRSRAGFRPGPVGPPMEVTRPHTMKPTTMDAAAGFALPHGQGTGSTGRRAPA